MSPATRFAYVLRWPLLCLWLGLVCLLLGPGLTQTPWFHGFPAASPLASVLGRLPAAGFDPLLSGPSLCRSAVLGLAGAYGLAFLLIVCPGRRAWETPALPRIPSPAFSLGFSLAAALLAAGTPAIPLDLDSLGSAGLASAAAFCLTALFTRLLWRRHSDYVRLQRFAALFLAAALARPALDLFPYPLGVTGPSAPPASQALLTAALAALWSLGLLCRTLFLARLHEQQRRFLAELGGTFGDLPPLPKNRTGSKIS